MQNNYLPIFSKKSILVNSCPVLPAVPELPGHQDGHTVTNSICLLHVVRGQDSRSLLVLKRCSNCPPTKHNKRWLKSHTLYILRFVLTFKALISKFLWERTHLSTPGTKVGTVPCLRLSLVFTRIMQLYKIGQILSGHEPVALVALTTCAAWLWDPSRLTVRPRAWPVGCPACSGQSRAGGRQRDSVRTQRLLGTPQGGDSSSSPVPCVSAPRPASSWSSAGGLLNPGHSRCCGTGRKDHTWKAETAMVRLPPHHTVGERPHLKKSMTSIYICLYTKCRKSKATRRIRAGRFHRKAPVWRSPGWQPRNSSKPWTAHPCCLCKGHW